MDNVSFDDFLKSKNLQTVMYAIGMNEPERKINVVMTYCDLFAIVKAFRENKVIREEWLKEAHKE